MNALHGMTWYAPVAFGLVTIHLLGASAMASDPCSAGRLLKRFKGPDVEIVKAKGAIPARVLDQITFSGGFGVADRDEKWSAGCLGKDKLPRERLMFAAVAGDSWLLYTEGAGKAA